MTKKLDPTNMCRQCKRKVGKGDSICCFCCSVWYHLKCSGLSKTEFENHPKNKNLYWSCPDCLVYRCGKCVKIIGKNENAFSVIVAITGFKKSVLFSRKMSLKH